MKDSLSKSLSQFVSNMNENSSFDNPFGNDIENTENSRLNMKTVIDRSYEHKETRKKTKKDKVSRILDDGNSLISNVMNEDSIDDFDGFIGDFMLDDEDVELRRNLIRYGRKYARETKVSAETSEISKAYSESEKLLSELLGELEDDKKAVQSDISNMRMMRTRNYKALSDLIEAKAQFHNTALSAIKEMNNMKKAQFELQMKVDRSKKESEENDSSANRAIQQLFGIGRDSIMGSLGGYSGVSGADDLEAAIESNEYGLNEDEYIQQKYFNDNEDFEESDGDKFLKYEGMGVHYILLYDDNNYREIIAEDKDGNIVPDYPLPSDPDNLDFTISESTGTAVDNLANSYELRHI